MDMLLSAVDQGQSHYSTINHDDPYQDASFEDDPDTAIPTDSIAPSANEVTHERWEKTPRPRGRQAKDPHAEYVRFDCKDVDDLETNLREYLEAPTASAEHATLEFHWPVTAAFSVYTRDFKRNPSTLWTPAEPGDLLRKTAVSVIEVLQPTDHPKSQIVRQKAVARTLVEAIQRADGFKYSFHNNWLSREDKAHRFSFFCNDSTLNKGRAANGGAGTAGKEKKKAVYDCKGLIAVKFSVTKNNLELHYRHVPLHKTWEERAPVPRKDSKRWKMLEIMDPEAIKKRTEKPEKKKRGRPRNEGDEKRPRKKKRTVSGPAEDRDEALQPLIDFLGSAERQTPANGVQDISSDDEDGGIQLTGDADDDCATPGSAFPANKRKDLSSGSKKRSKASKRAKDSHEPGTLTWGRNKTAESFTHDGNGRAIDSDPKSLSALEKSQKSNSKNGKKSGPTAASPVSELEALKQQLAAMTQKVDALESAKRLPPPYPPYPPYGFGWPPYQYPPPPHCYPPPPNGWQAPPPQTYAQGSGPPMYPGGPPHPNTSRTTPIKSAAQIEQDKSTATNKEASNQEQPASDRADQEGAKSPTRDEETPSQHANERSTSTPSRPTTAQRNDTLNISAPVTITPDVSSSTPVASLPAVQPQPPNLPRPIPVQPATAQPMMGVLVPEGQHRAPRKEHVTHTFQTGAPILTQDDSRMKSLFDSAIAAIAGPNPVQATKHAATPGARNAAKAMDTLPPPQSRTIPPPPQPYPPPHYPGYPAPYPSGPYPWPSPANPYAVPPGYGPAPPMVSPSPAQKPGERPPPGYDELRAQMMAHAQTAPKKKPEKSKKPVEIRFESDVVSARAAKNAKGKQVQAEEAAPKENAVVEAERAREVVNVSSNSSRSVSVATAPEQAEQTGVGTGSGETKSDSHGSSDAE